VSVVVGWGVGGEALSQIAGIEKGVEGFLASKLAAQADTEEIKKIKGLIRETEAWSAARYCGVKVTTRAHLSLHYYLLYYLLLFLLQLLLLRLLTNFLEKMGLEIAGSHPQPAPSVLRDGQGEEEAPGQGGRRHRQELHRFGQAPPDLLRRRSLGPARHPPGVPQRHHLRHGGAQGEGMAQGLRGRFFFSKVFVFPFSPVHALRHSFIYWLIYLFIDLLIDL
jgi:hypothetical protein